VNSAAGLGEPRDVRLSVRAARFIDRLGSEMEIEIVGIIGVEPDGRLFVIPRPGDGRGLFRALGGADWEAVAHIAAEWDV